MEDTVDVQLPVSGKVAKIRNYTTRLDDEKAYDILTDGANQDPLTGLIQYPVANFKKHSNYWVETLIESVDGSPDDLQTVLKNMRSTDYNAIRVKVEEIVEAQSPKVKGADSASKPSTKES